MISEQERNRIVKLPTAELQRIYDTTNDPDLEELIAEELDKREWDEPRDEDDSPSLYFAHYFNRKSKGKETSSLPLDNGFRRAIIDT